MIPLNMKTGITIDAEQCGECEAQKRRACNALYPEGSWPATGSSMNKPCPGILVMPGGYGKA